MVTQIPEWKSERIRNEFDPELQKNADLYAYAEMAADYLDREAGTTYPTLVRWSLGPHGREMRPNNGSCGPSISVELKDLTLGVGIKHHFPLDELKGVNNHFSILRLWADFLELRMGQLHTRVFPRPPRAEDLP